MNFLQCFKIDYQDPPVFARVKQRQFRAIGDDVGAQVRRWFEGVFAKLFAITNPVRFDTFPRDDEQGRALLIEKHRGPAVLKFAGFEIKQFTTRLRIDDDGTILRTNNGDQRSRPLNGSCCRSAAPSAHNTDRAAPR